MHSRVLQIVLFATLISTVRAEQCSSSLTVSCTTNVGNPGDRIVKCEDSTHTLVSCGIRNNATGKSVISKGTWMSEDECKIDYHVVVPTPSPTVNPTANPTLNQTKTPTTTPTSNPTAFPIVTAPTSSPTYSPTASSTHVRPYARCCNFADCFSDFECTLSVSREKKRSPNAASCSSEAFPHLLSCGLGVYNNKQQLEAYFQNSGTNSNVTFTMKDDYLNLFGLPTTSPTETPTKSPSSSPTKFPITASPTKTNQTKSPITASTTASPSDATPNPTPKPTISTSHPSVSPTSIPSVSPIPTATVAPSQSPTKYERNRASYAQAVNTVWVHTVWKTQTAYPECVPQTQTVSNYTWLYSLCCTEKDNNKYTSNPTVPPTPQPTMNPTNSTPAPAPSSTWRLADIRSVGATYTTPFYPINCSRNTTTEFEDFNNGQITRIAWGVSNIKRTYDIATAPNKPGIIGMKDENQSEWYFTIKDWKATTAFTSQYGNIHIPNEETCRYCNCTQIHPINTQDDRYVNKVIVYSDTTKSKILGMTMITKDGTSFTCHINMGKYNMSGPEVEANLSSLNLNATTNPARYVLDYTECSGYLAGFSGSAPKLGIDYIGFYFSGSEDATPNCLYSDGSTATTPSPLDATLRPSPSPSRKSTGTPTEITGAPTEVTGTQYTSNGRTLGCYYVMDKQQVTCLGAEETIKYPQSVGLDNPSFMTACVGYSETDDIKTWYIDGTTAIDTCVVEGYDNSAVEIAAIGTCCTLVDPVVEDIPCEKTKNLWCFLGIENDWEKVLYSLIVVVVALFWIGAIVWCCYATKQQADKEALRKRLADVEVIEDKDGDKVRIFTEEQEEHQKMLNKLERFEVDEKTHEEMVENERLLSNDVGLIP